LREDVSARTPFVACELPLVSTKPPFTCAFHSTVGVSSLGSSSLPKTNFGSDCARAVDVSKTGTSASKARQ
jgi:hypothetical protein